MKNLKKIPTLVFLGLSGITMPACNEHPRWVMWTDGPGGWVASLEYNTLKECERGIFPGLEKYVQCLPYGMTPLIEK